MTVTPPEPSIDPAGDGFEIQFDVQVIGRQKGRGAPRQE